MVERFPVLRHDLNALYAGYYLAELLADGTQDYDPHPSLFDAALGTLRGLGESFPSPPEERAKTAALDAVTAFELVWLKELGYSPRLDACTGCGRVVPPGVGRVLFSPLAGGVLCSACGTGFPDRRPLSGSGLTALRELVAEGGAAPDLSRVRGELRLLLGHAISTVLGRRPRLLGYVEGR
jgi:DNA repair protein RecO (recombination protein O)